MKKNSIRLILYFLSLFLTIRFPHYFSYEFGRNSFLIFMMVIVLLEINNTNSAVKFNLPEKVEVFIRGNFTFLLLVVLTFFLIGSLNEKLFDAHSADHSTLKGFATNAGYIPNSDGALYLLGIQSFLQYGILTFNTIYRPLAHTFNAVLFKLSGSDMIHFFYLTTFLLIGASSYLGNILSRYISKIVATITTFLVVFYFSRFQATFLTELSGGIIGMTAMSAMIVGYFKKDIFIFSGSLILFAVAMQIRMGAVFIAPFCILVGLLRINKGSWVHFSVKAFVLSAFFILGILLPVIQLHCFKEKSVVESNAGYFLYQIQTGSNSWRQVIKDYPEEFLPGMSYEETAKKAKLYAKEKIMAAPGIFLKNYGIRIVEVLKEPWDFLFHFWGIGKGQTGIMFFILFCLTPFIYASSNPIRIIFWLLIAMILGAVISSPLLEEVRRRTYASSITLNAMCTAIAVQNLLQLFLILIQNRFNFIKIFSKKLNPLNPFRDLKKEINHAVAGHQILPIIIFIILFIFIGPVIADQLRKEVKTDLTDFVLTVKNPENELFLIDPSNAQGVLIHTDKNFKIDDPKVISGEKFKNNNHLSDTLHGSYYVFNALNLLSDAKHPFGLPFVMIPEEFIEGVQMENAPIILLEGKLIKPKKNLLFEVENIQIPSSQHK